MKKLNTLKLILAIGLASFFKAEAQYVDYGYWNSSTSNSKDVGQAVAWDENNAKIYVGGDQKSGLLSQGIRILKYDEGCTQLGSKLYDSTGYKESVKQILCRKGRIYVVGNATDTSGNSVMFLLRLNSSLTIEKVKWYNSANYNSPVDATVGGNNDIYIACYKKVSGVNKFAILRVDTNFATINSVVPSDTTYKRTPKDIHYYGGYVYVAGSAKSGTISNNTSCFAMRFAGALGLLWEHYGSSAALGQNGYNTIAVNSNYVYVGGSELNTNDQRWVMRRLNRASGVVSATHRIGGTNFSGDIASVVRITLATNDTVIVAGYVKNQSLNTFTIKSAKYNSSLGGYTVANSTLPYGSALNDAVTYPDGRRSILTGSRIYNSSNAFYFQEVDNYDMQLDGGKINTNRNTAGNRIVLTPNSNNSHYAAITGFEDFNTGVQPEDLRMMTLSISPQIDRLASSSSELQSSFTMYPNPATDLITIESTEPISSFVIYDMMGKSVMEQQSVDENFQKTINISALPQGIYLLKVNNNSTQKLIKN